MLKLPRLLLAMFSLSLRRELAFRADLLFRVSTAVVDAAAGLLALGLVYTRTQTLGGWTLGETIVLLGTYQIASGLLATFIEPNLAWFGGHVRSGKLDETLLRPVSSLFLASLGSCSPLGLVGVATGAAVLGLGLAELGVAPAASGVAAWLVLLAAAMAVTWASRVLVACVTLWAPGAELDVVYGAVWQFGRYPVSLYRRPLRFVLTWLLPVAFVATFPAAALTRGVRLELLVGGLAVGFGAILLARAVWRRGLRRYTSATS